ncbi:MAG: hypothetical protein K9K21_04315 [Desulfotignum sp.]|nr:hypothetical protein [Desulfotignum sp.]
MTTLPIKHLNPTILPDRLALKSPLKLIEHIDDILDEAHGFGSFLFNTQGQTVVEHGGTWLYTTLLANGNWESWVRPFDLKTMKAGPSKRVLVPLSEDLRGAVLHHVIRITPDFFVGFFSNGRGVRAAVATTPDAIFTRDTYFGIDPVQGWETHEETIDGWALEANGAFVKIYEDVDSVIFWEGYDSYLSSRKLGDLAWAKIRIDKNMRNISLVERHPNNPLPFRDSSWSCARCGGNLSSNVRIDGQHAFFYYFRPFNSSNAFIGLALCSDPLFQKNVTHFLVDHMHGQEDVAEKFQVIQKENELLLFSENRFKDGSWRTGVRRFSMSMQY